MQRRVLYLILVLVIFINCAFAKEDYTIKKLPTGQTVIVKTVPQNQIVTIDTWIKTGSINETDKTSGIAHFLEHLFFKGTEKYPTKEFDKILESKGAVVNAATSKDYTHYYITLPSDHFDLAMELHADMLLNPAIPNKELEKERLVVLEEIAKGLDSPYSVMYKNLFKEMYRNSHPYTRPVIGDKKVIETVTRDEIFNYYNSFYTPDKMTTVVVGNVEADYAIKKVSEYFGEKTFPKPTNVKIQKPETIKSQRRISGEKNVKTGYLLLGYQTVKFSDVKDIYALDVLATILGGSESSKLNQSLKKQKELVHSISCASSNLRDDGIFTISATFMPDNVKNVENEIYKEIESVKRGDFTQGEIDKAKNILETDTYYARESVSNISNELGYTTLFFNNLNFYDNYLKNIKNVTKEDVIRVAKKYLVKDKSVVSTIMPEGFTLKEDKISSDKKYKADIKEQNKDVVKYRLENGITLIIKHKTVNNIIAFNIKARGGNFLENIPSVALLTAQTATEGTRSYSDKEFASFLDEKGIKLNLQSSADTFNISMLTTKNELKDSFLALDEVVNYPLFLQTNIDKAKRLKLADIKEMKDDPLSYALDTFKGEAFQGSIYGNNSKIIEENINKVTREDILTYYNKVLCPKNLTVTVVGDVQDEEIIQNIASIFDKRDNKQMVLIELKKLDNKLYKPQKNTEKIISKKGTNAAWILIGFKTTNAFNKEDLVNLKIINAVLGQGMSSRLFTNLRDNKGLAYAVGSVMMQNALDGIFTMYIGTNPEKIEKAKRAMLHELNIIKTQYITQKELDDAKDKILGNLVISIETNMDDAALLSGQDVLGRHINYLEEYKDLIRKATVTDILSTANKYFSEPHIITIIKD